MSAWQALDAELALWRSAGRSATLWCRDDDASRDSSQLQRMLDSAERAAVPIAVAAIPATLEPCLVTALAQSRFAIVAQHGYAHRNHAPPAERKMELGPHRALDESLAELAHGADILRRNFGDRFVAVLVPPWNRIADAIVARLLAQGFCGVSTLGPRSARCPAEGLVQCNTHVDIIDWRRDRAFIGVDAAIDRVVAHLRARREGAADTDEPTGVLTHHLDMGAPAWEFLTALVARTREQGAVWIDARVAFGMEAGAAPICGRSA
jgi:hypothetical protein